MTSIILSIKPKYADLILEGKKTIEIRKTYPRNLTQSTDKIHLYATAPIKKVIGDVQCHGSVVTNPSKFIVASLLHGNSEPIRMVEEQAQLTYKEMQKYAGGLHGNIWVWKLYNPQRFPTPMPLEHWGISRPPQSFCYVKDE